MSPHVSIDRDAVSAFCQRHHIARLAMFGSVLRDDFGPDSDVDVLVEFEAGYVPGFNFVSIEREFSGLLRGHRVDMVTPKFLNARIRNQILSSAEPLYVAADLVYLGHMLDTAKNAISKTQSLSRSAYGADQNLRLALIHLVRASITRMKHRAPPTNRRCGAGR